MFLLLLFHVLEQKLKRLIFLTISEHIFFVDDHNKAICVFVTSGGVIVQNIFANIFALIIFTGHFNASFVSNCYLIPYLVTSFDFRRGLQAIT